MSFLSRWGPGRLLLAWCGYWLALVLAVIAPGLPTLWRISRPGAKGSASVSMANGELQVRLVQEAASVWTRDFGFLSLSLWIAIPPLLLWIFWLRAQRERAVDSRDRVGR